MLKNKFSLDFCNLLSDESFHKYTCNIGINNSYLCTEDDVLRSMRGAGACMHLKMPFRRGWSFHILGVNE